MVAGIAVVRGLSSGGGGADLALALGVGTSLAACTVIDDRGVEHAGAIPYLASVLVPSAVAMLVLRRWAERGRTAPSGPRADGGKAGFAGRLGLTPRVLAVGAGMAGAYLLTLAALDRASPGGVAATRETSVVLAVAFAAATGRERVGAARAAGAALVVAGLAALALGGG